MIFYEIITRKTRSENKEDTVEKQKCRESTETLYQNSEENVFVAVSAVSEFTCSLIAAIKPEMTHKYTAALLVEEFNKTSELNLTVKNYREISLNMFKHLLRRAESGEYIEDGDKVISGLKLQCGYGYRELIAKEVSRKQIEELAQELLYDKSMKTEIDRIYQVKNESEKLNHPVHYIIRSDNEDDYRDKSNLFYASKYVRLYIWR